MDLTLSPTARIVGFTLDSAGGNVMEARIFAQVIQGKPALQAYVADHRECSSACFLIWAAARYRQASPTASIGVHSISVYGQEAFDTKAWTTDLARELAIENVSPAVIGKLVSTPPSEISWLTPADLKSMNVEIVPSNGALVPLFAR